MFEKIYNLRTAIAKAAQEIYDNWDQEDEFCPYGGGGICDDIAFAIADVLESNEIDTTEGGQPGDDHAWIIAYDTESEKAYGVDIPHRLYEEGGGYSWTKKEGIIFSPEDVEIWEIEYDLLYIEEEY